jgi:hypothetical protein
MQDSEKKSRSKRRRERRTRVDALKITGRYVHQGAELAEVSETGDFAVAGDRLRGSHYTRQSIGEHIAETIAERRPPRVVQPATRLRPTSWAFRTPENSDAG